MQNLLRNAHCGVNVSVRARILSWALEGLLDVGVPKFLPRLTASLALALGLVAGVQAAGASYVYDELGRLIQVIAADGTSTQYTYDPAGNILAVRANTTSTLAITSFYPESGSIGSTVTITGSGFSATAGGNTVTFNGTAASVTAATTTQLTVTVPAGATTGSIAVSNPNGSVTSSHVFAVGLGNAPAITSFSPNIGNPGAAVTITGQGFQAVASDNRVAFNSMALATISAVTATTLSTSVPSPGASGKLTVATIYGSTTSTADFLAVPTSLTPSQVQAWTRASVGGAARPLSINIAQDAGAILFDGTTDQLVFIDMSGSTISPSGSAVTYEVYGPQGTRFATGTVSAAQPVAYLPPLTANGTYAIFFEPGTATANLSVALKTGATIALAVDGPSVNISTSLGLYASFQGMVGQNLGLGLSGLAFNGGASGYVTLVVYKPDGSQWQSVRCNTSDPGSSCGLALKNLPRTGSYMVQVVNPGSTPITGGALTLSSDKTSTLTSGTAYSLSLRQAQNGRLTFAGTAGQPATIRFENIATTLVNQPVTVTILKPDGSALTTAVSGSTSTNGGVIYVASLPTTGNYTVTVTVLYGSAATMSVTFNPASELVIDGAAVNITTAATGYGTSLSFQATAGQNLGLGLSGLTFAGGSSGYLSMSIVLPDGSTMSHAEICGSASPGGACGLTLTNLPQTGTYLLLVSDYQASYPAITGGTLTLSSDKTSTLTSGAAYSLSLRQAQNGRLTFAGTAGQPATIRFENITTTLVNQPVTVTILKPDGSALTAVSGSASTNGGVIYVASLPTTGNYTVIVTVLYGSAATMSVTLNPASELIIDGAAVNITTAASGYGTSLSFQATAGQNLGLGLSGLTFAGGSSGYLSMSIVLPDGSTMSHAEICGSASPGGACGLTLTNLPQTGTYLLLVSDYAGSYPAITGGTLTLSSDKTSTLTAGTAYSLSVRQAQNGRLTFAGTAGQPATIRFENIATTLVNQPVAVTILKPDGSALTTAVSGSTSTNGGVIYVASLPTTGNYTVIVTVLYGSAMTMSVTFNPASELVINGSTVNITTAASGYGTSLSFQATAGQNLGLGLSGLTFSGGGAGYLSLSIVQPDGSTMSHSEVCGSASPGGACGLTMTNLPQTGTYLLLVSDYAGSYPAITGGALTLSSDKTSTLTSGTAYSLSLRQAQNGRLTFAGTAGQPATIRFKNIAATLVNQPVAVTILKPDGSALTTAVSGSTSTNGGVIYVASLPTTGNYTVTVTVLYGSAATMSVTFNPASELVIDGAAVNITTAASGYGTSLSFQATAGQNLGLGLSGLTFSGGGTGYLSMSIVQPDASTMSHSEVCGSASPGGACGLTLTNLPQTGTYLLLVSDYAGSYPAITGGTLTLSSDKTSTLTSGTPYSLSMRQAQNGRLTFAGTAVAHTLTVGTPTTVPSGQTVAVKVVDASGATVASGSYSSAGGTLTLGTLSVATYTVLVTTLYGASTSVTLTYQ